MAVEKDRTLFGTKVFNYQTKEHGILLYTWINVFADGKVIFATCVNKDGKKYNVPMDLINPIE